MKIFRSLLVSTVLMSLLTYANAQNLSESQAEKVMWDYLEEYSPVSYEMMKDLKTRPSSFQLGSTNVKLPNETPPLSWVGEFTNDGVRQSLNTIVHETIHGYTSSWPYVILEKQSTIKYKFRDNYSAYFLAKGETYLVKHTKIFSSNEIANNIPEELRTFRFDPYLSPRDNELGSQAQGIYGLMDEWNAYYHGTRTALELFEYYQEHAVNDPSIFLEHISDLAGTYFAHYEFKYYILAYLIHAKQNYPEIYQGILENKELIQAYRAVDTKYEKVIFDFQSRLDKLENNLKSEAGLLTASRQNGFYFIGRKGVGLFAKERDRLILELAKPEFMVMHEKLSSGT